MEVLNNYQRKKLDESNHEEFYSDPKFVYHLDANLRNYLSNVYKNGISQYDLAYLSSKKVLKNKNFYLQNDFQKDNLAA